MAATSRRHTAAAISSVDEDEAGEFYLADLRNGRVYRVTARPR